MFSSFGSNDGYPDMARISPEKTSTIIPLADWAEDFIKDFPNSF